MGEGKTPEHWDEWTAKMQAAHGNGNGHGKSLSIEAQRLLPTPQAADGYHDARVNTGGNPTLVGATVGYRPNDVDKHGRGAAPIATDWGVYADAVARWEVVLGHPAPPPTQPSRKGTPQLSARFSEWLMGLPAGWVTDVPGITRNEALRALGNGVVPQQCAAALRLMLGQAVAAQSAPVDLLPTPEGSDGSGGRVSAERGGKRPSGAKRAVTLATAVDHIAGEQCGCLGWDQPHRKGRGSCIYAPGLVDDGETDA